MTRPYRPSNGTEGVYFMADFCDKCGNDTEENPCPIIGMTMAFGVDEPEYPKEWIQDEAGPGEFPIKNPRCTNFKAAERNGRKAMTTKEALEILEHYTIVGYPMVPGQPQDLKDALVHLAEMAEDYERARPLLEAAKKALLCGPVGIWCGRVVGRPRCE